MGLAIGFYRWGLFPMTRKGVLILGLFCRAVFYSRKSPRIRTDGF